jgi:hypothetical protein
MRTTGTRASGGIALQRAALAAAGSGSRWGSRPIEYRFHAITVTSSQIVLGAPGRYVTLPP